MKPAEKQNPHFQSRPESLASTNTIHADLQTSRLKPPTTMSHPIIYNSSLGISLMLVGLGLNASFRPDAHLRALEFPVPSEPLARKFSHALMRIWGIRNISVGLLLSVIWTAKDEGLMAKALCAVLTLPVTDGFVSRLVIGGGEFQHWIFPPITVVMIAGLFGLF